MGLTVENGLGFRRVDKRVPVDVGLDSDSSVGISIFLPEKKGQVYTDLPVVFAFPGGTYSRRYFDMQVPGRHGYSMAEHLASLGAPVVTCDYVGLGDSTPIEPFEAISKEIVLTGIKETVARAVEHLSDHVDGDRLGTTSGMIGLGHSLGGYLLALTQSRSRLFGALGILGYSPLRRDDPLNDQRHKALMSVLSDPTDPRPFIDESYFYHPSIPRDVIAADRAQAVKLFAWALGPQGNMSVIDPEISDAVRSIDVPLFLAFGETDMSPDPYLEPTAYRRCTDLTLFVLQEAAHCHNLANTRERLFDRLASWVGSVKSVESTSP